MLRRYCKVLSRYNITLYYNVSFGFLFSDGCTQKFPAEFLEYQNSHTYFVKWIRYFKSSLKQCLIKMDKSFIWKERRNKAIKSICYALSYGELLCGFGGWWEFLSPDWTTQQYHYCLKFENLTKKIVIWFPLYFHTSGILL